jgi:hypothetical protein
MILDLNSIGRKNSISVYRNLEECFLSGITELEGRSQLLEIGPGIRPLILLDPPTVRILVEPSPQYCEALSRMIGPVENTVIVNQYGMSFLKTLADNSIDSIVLSDVIEHLEKHDGYELLIELERVARNQIAIFTPLGFMPQHFDGTGDSWGFNETELQTHRSGWLPSDFNEAWNFKIAFRAHVDTNGEEFGAMWAILKKPAPAVPSSALLFSPTKEVDRDSLLFRYSHEKEKQAIISFGHSSKSKKSLKRHSYYGDNFGISRATYFRPRKNNNQRLTPLGYLKFGLVVFATFKSYSTVRCGNLTRPEKIIVNVIQRIRRVV